MSGFSSTASVVNTDLNNMVRGFYRDNTTHALTGTTAETDFGSVSIPGDTIGATGLIHLIVGGTSSGAGGTKSIKLYIGGFLEASVSIASGTQSWYLDCWIHNTAANAQRLLIFQGYTSNCTVGVGNSALDTSATQTLKVTGTLASAGDTLSELSFNVFVCQIT